MLNVYRSAYDIIKWSGDGGGGAAAAARSMRMVKRGEEKDLRRSTQQPSAPAKLRLYA